MKRDIESDGSNGGILAEGGWTKTTSDKTFQTKESRTKPPNKNPANHREVLCTGGFVRDFVLLTIGGSEMCDVL